MPQTRAQAKGGDTANETTKDDTSKAAGAKRKQPTKEKTDDKAKTSDTQNTAKGLQAVAAFW